MKFLKAIAAMAENRVIGAGNSIPWRLPEDFQWFKQTTMGNVILMGRKTFESIGKPLPGRRTIILSTSNFSALGTETISSLHQLPSLEIDCDIYVCGGAQIYRLALPFCADLFMTHVKMSPAGDTFFPDFEQSFMEKGLIKETAQFRICHYINPNPKVLKPDAHHA